MVIFDPYPAPCGNGERTQRMIGSLERVPLREVWVHEALDFTQWLELNIDVLNDALDLEIVSVDREQSAGKFSIDLPEADTPGSPATDDLDAVPEDGSGWH